MRLHVYALLHINFATAQDTYKERERGGGGKERGERREVKGRDGGK